jgi:hypothetical protein
MIGPENDGWRMLGGQEEVEGTSEHIRDATQAVVLLTHDSLAMSTNFVAFHLEFRRRGIKGEYYSIRSLENAIKRYDPLKYGQRRGQEEPKNHLGGRSRKILHSVRRPKGFQKKGSGQNS